MEKFKALLQKSKTLDLDKVALIIVLTKFVFTNEWPTILALFLVLLNHNARRFQEFKSQKQSDEREEAFQKLQADFEKLNKTVSLQQLRN